VFDSELGDIPDGVLAPLAGDAVLALYAAIPDEGLSQGRFTGHRQAG
jgi:hypothetical protein